MNRGELSHDEKTVQTFGLVLEVGSLSLPPRSIRTWLDRDSPSLRELASSIKIHGLLQPLVVCRHQGMFRIIAGERRFHAAQLAGLRRLPCVEIEPPSTDAALWELQLVENVQREDLSPMEEGAAYRALNEECGLTMQTIAERVGKSKSHISRAIGISKLPEDIRHTVAMNDEEGRGAIPFEHLAAIAQLSDDEVAQRRLLKNVIELRPTVRELRASLRDDKPRGESRAGWSTARFNDPKGEFLAMIHFKKKHATPTDIERAAILILQDARRAKQRGVT